MNTASKNSGHDSRSRFVKVLETPISDLARGKITGGGNYRYLIAEAGFSVSLQEALEAKVQQTSWRPGSRLRLAKSMISACQKLLKQGRTADALAGSLSMAGAKPRGISWATHLILAGELPDGALRLLGEITAPIRSHRLRIVARQTLAADWSQALREGATVAELRTYFPDTAILGASINELRSVDVSWTQNLPAELSRVVLDVVQRTRLWPSEKQDVALELSEHFAGGIEAGEGPETLLESFGDANVAARLIRRAKTRCRPALWWAWRRSWRLTAAAASGLFVLWLVLMLRMLAGTPAVKVNYIARFDQRNHAIAPEDRAWPLYREGLLELTKRDPSWHEIRKDIFTRGVKSEHWPLAKAFLVANRAQLETFIKASKRPRLGFFFNDKTNASWLRKSMPSGGGDASNLYDFNEPLANCLLPHAQELRQISDLMRIAIMEAAQQQEDARVAELLEAMIHLSGHAGETSDFVVSKYIGRSIILDAGEQLMTLLAERPNSFDDDQLVHFAQLLNAQWRTSRADFSGETAFIDDFLQRVYTDDGQGDGRVTSVGMRFLCSAQLILSSGERSKTNLLLGHLPLFDGDSTPPLADKVRFNAIAPGAASLMAGRREMRSKMMELQNLFLDDLNRPYWERNGLKFVAAYDKLAQTERARYLPALLAMGWYRHGFIASARLGNAIAAGRRGACQTAIALARYHRQHKQWPKTLNALVPDLLPKIPTDPFDGRPLRYRSQPDNSPLLYSVGPDQRDDLAAPLYSSTTLTSSVAKPSEILQGDWKLFPPR